MQQQRPESPVVTELAMDTVMGLAVGHSDRTRCVNAPVREPNPVLFLCKNVGKTEHIL